MDISLVIMAAGIGSRYKGGIKQLEAMDDAGRVIMDYAVYDAIEAGFRHIVFVIRREIEDDFNQIIGNRIRTEYEGQGITFEYAFQELADLPEEVSVPEDRNKPWGTGQAVLSCRNLIHGPFGVINADDYYGKEAFSLLYRHLAAMNSEPNLKNSGNEPCLIGFILKNTLSENGGVTRGICQVTESGDLLEIVETKNIVKTQEGALANGVTLNPDCTVSMNMWGFGPEFMVTLREEFSAFLEEPENLEQGEFLIPIVVGNLLSQGKLSVSVYSTQDSWFGITYEEDLSDAKAEIAKLLAAGAYPFH